VLAEQGAVRAGQDPRYPQESVAGYRERISAAREALEYWRKRHAA